MQLQREDGDHDGDAGLLSGRVEKKLARNNRLLEGEWAHPF
jgi:hypothetical protein